MEGIAYVAHSNRFGTPAGLGLFDITVPVSPVELSFLPTAVDARDVEVHDGLAYLVTAGELKVVDVSNPRNPVELGSASVGQAEAVEVVGSLAYVASREQMVVIDISNPGSLIEVGMLSLSSLSDLDVESSIAYVTSRLSGLHIYNVSSPGGIVEISHYQDASSRSFSRIEVMGELAIVGAERNLHPVVHVLDVSDPAEPKPLGRLDHRLGLGTVDSIQFSGSLALIGMASAWHVLDLGNPSDPRLLGSLDSTSTARDAVITGDVAVLAEGGGGLGIVDFSNPHVPRQIGGVDRFARYVEVEDDRAYVLDSDALRVLDVSDPSNLVELGALEFRIRDQVEIERQVAYIFDAVGGGPFASSI